MRNPPGIVQLLQAEHRVAQLGRASRGQSVSRQLLELRDDIGRSREVPLAAPWRFLRAFEALAAAKLYFDAHRVAAGRAPCGDGGVGPDFDPFREGHAL